MASASENIKYRGFLGLGLFKGVFELKAKWTYWANEFIKIWDWFNHNLGLMNVWSVKSVKRWIHQQVL